jgi:hypothetical protein
LVGEIGVKGWAIWVAKHMLDPGFVLVPTHRQPPYKPLPHPSLFASCLSETFEKLSPLIGAMTTGVLFHKGAAPN